MTVVTRIVQTGTINGVPQYRYETAEKTYYVKDEEKASDVAIEVDAYTAVTVTLPVYSGGSISGTRTATYYQSAGKQTLTPTKKSSSTWNAPFIPLIIRSLPVPLVWI